MLHHLLPALPALLQHTTHLSAQVAVLPTITPNGIPGVDGAINTLVGWALWIVSILSIIGLFIVGAVGFESYRHNQAEQFMEKAKSWILAAVIGAFASKIVQIFFPGFQLTAQATAIPGLDGPVTDIIGNIVWLLGWAAFACLIFLAVRGFIAFQNNGVDQFVSKFVWFIVASLVISFATQIAGAFFPAALNVH